MGYKNKINNMFIKTTDGGYIVIDAISYVGAVEDKQGFAIYRIYLSSSENDCLLMDFTEEDHGKDFKERAEESRRETMEKIESWYMRRNDQSMIQNIANLQTQPVPTTIEEAANQFN